MMAVYLLHLDSPLKHARHYIGYASKDWRTAMVDYRKFSHKKFGKMYVAVVSLPGKKAHVSRWIHKTASKALAYGYRLEARYQRLVKAAVK